MAGDQKGFKQDLAQVGSASRWPPENPRRNLSLQRYKREVTDLDICRYQHLERPTSAPLP